MDALDLRGVHPDLVRRAGRRQVGDGLRVQLHGQVAVRPALAVLLVVVGAQRRLDDREEGPQDPVLVQGGDLVERPVQLLQQPVGQLGAGPLAVRGHPRLEQRDQQPGGVDVVGERLLHVRLAEGRTGLPQVLGVGPQHHRLAPVEAGAQHQRVEVVALGGAGPHGGEGVLEALAGVVALDVLRHPQPEVVDPGDGGVGAAQLVRTLVDDLDAQAVQAGQHPGQRDRLAPAVDLEAALAGARVDRLVEADREVAARLAVELLQMLDVGDGAARAVVGLVALGEGVAVAARQFGGALLADLGVQRLGEAVGPGAGGFHQPALQAVGVGVGELRQAGARLDADDEVQPGEDRLGVPGGEVDAGAAQFLLEDVDQAQPHTGGVAVARR